MRACHDHKRRSWRSRHEHVLYKSSTGFKSHASNNADCVIQTKPALKKGIEKVDHGQQRSHDAMSVDQPHLSFAPSTSSIEFEVPQEIDPVVYASMQQPPSRKAKKS